MLLIHDAICIMLLIHDAICIMLLVHRYGPNALTPPHKPGFFYKLWLQINTTMLRKKVTAIYCILNPNVQHSLIEILITHMHLTLRDECDGIRIEVFISCLRHCLHRRLIFHSIPAIFKACASNLHVSFNPLI
jgi:hypothetical protein